MDAYEKGADLAEVLYVKLGETLSAPINFMCSRPYYRYLEQLSSPSEKSDFAKGYRDTWTWKNIRSGL
tara:strand:- start:160 stop:363 length:204 start_codon:yes stop_codon:yes gene_type:complete